LARIVAELQDALGRILLAGLTADEMGRHLRACERIAKFPTADLFERYARTLHGQPDLQLNAGGRSAGPQSSTPRPESRPAYRC
jgi:hypothetical protein